MLPFLPLFEWASLLRVSKALKRLVQDALAGLTHLECNDDDDESKSYGAANILGNYVHVTREALLLCRRLRTVSVSMRRFCGATVRAWRCSSLCWWCAMRVPCDG